MSAIFDQGSPAPCPNPFNLAAYVLAQASKQPQKLALSIVGLQDREDWSYHALNQAVLSTAQGLLDLGLHPGDRILMRLGNSVDFPICFLAAIAVGLIPVPTSAMLSTPEVDKLAIELLPKLVVTAPGVAGPSFAGPSVPGSDTTKIPQLSLSELQELRSSPPAEFLMGDPERLAYIIYTSGTSGKPTAVCHAHRAIWARRMMWQDWYGLRPDDRVMHAGAFNWTYTLGTGLMDPWTIGATAIIPANSVPPTALPQLIRSHMATIFAAAPGVYRQMLKSTAQATYPNLRHGLSAGEKLPDSARTAWEKTTGTQIYEAFGMSECSTFVSSNPSTPATSGTMGTAQTGRRVAVLGPDNSVVSHDTPGILAISTQDQGLMLGYLSDDNQPDVTPSNEWFLTGDTVSMAPDGYITYLGRSDDMMNAGGFRVSPLEVEQVLIGHPQVEDCAVVTVSVKKDVQVIAAFYVSKNELTDHEFSAFTASRLARYKTPRIYCRLFSLPRSANGKLLRKKLRETYEAQHGQA